MRALYLTLALPFLIGCSATPEKEIVTRTVKAEVPVKVLCKAPVVERPTFELDKMSVNDDLYVKGRAAMAEIKQREAYEERLRAAVAACQ